MGARLVCFLRRQRRTTRAPNDPVRRKSDDALACIFRRSSRPSARLRRATGSSSSRLDPPVRGERTTDRERRVAIKDTRFSPAPQITSVRSNGEESRGPRIGRPVETFSAGEVGEGKAATMPLSLVFVILTAATGTGACRKFINRSRYSFEIVLFQPCHHPPCSNDVTITYLRTWRRGSRAISLGGRQSPTKYAILSQKESRQSKPDTDVRQD